METLSVLTRPIVTIMLTGALIYGFIAGKVSQDQFVPIVAIVIAFWFGQRSLERDKDIEKKVVDAATQRRK